MARNNKQYSIQLHPKIVEKVKSVADHQGKTFSQLIRNFIVIGLASSEFEKKEEKFT